MKINLRNKKVKGFTLVEIMLVVGLISLMSSVIYLKYKAYYLAAATTHQVQDLNFISNKINNAYQGSTSVASLNNTLAIASTLVPQDIKQPPNISNRYGGTLVLLGTTVAGSPAYEIDVNGITSEQCSALAGSDYAYNVDEVWVNGVLQKATGAQMTSANYAAIASACAISTSITFKNRVMFITPTNSYTQSRPNQTGQYYIPTVGNTVTTVGPTACAGGSAFNGSFCSCPAGTSWNGSACLSTANPLNCIDGQGADQTTGLCAALPATTPTTTYYNGVTTVTVGQTYFSARPATQAACTAANGYWDSATNLCGGVLPTAGGAVGAATPNYTGGRYLPNTYNAAIAIPQVVAELGSTSANASYHFDGRVNNYCPSVADMTAIVTTNGVVNAKTQTNLIVNMTNNVSAANVADATTHAVSSTWQVDRCVTPTSVAGPPFPQTVNW